MSVNILMSFDFPFVRLLGVRKFCYYPYRHIIKKRIGGVMVSVLASSAVDRGFEPRSNQAKDYIIGICCFPAKYVALWR